MMKLLKIFRPCLLIALIFSCNGQREVEAPEKILATIGKKTIAIDEFKYRTELTVRPIFPGQPPALLKNTYLNNLIIEKLLSLEAGKNNQLLLDKSFQAYLQGIKEQSMWEELYYQEAFGQAHPDTHEIQRVYQLAGREYELEFFSLSNVEFAEKMRAKLEANPDSAAVFFERLVQYAGRTYKKTVKYRDPEPAVIQNALFSEPLNPGAIVGPLNIDDNSYLLLRIVEWKDIPAISGEDEQQRWREVSEKLKQAHASRLWANYNQTIMAGKRIKFEKATFDQLAELFFSIKFTDRGATKSFIFQKFGNNAADELVIEQIENQPALSRLPFFTIDNEVWTVADFRNALKTHPLVFRQPHIKKQEFKKQFQNAIADLVRDHYLTKAAYKKKLDQSSKVRRRTEMWQDALIALNHWNKTLEQARLNNHPDSTNNVAWNNQYLEHYIFNLRQKYQQQIMIDQAGLEKIQLTNINLFLLQQGAPYPVVVPKFPIFTNNSDLFRK